MSAKILKTEKVSLPAVRLIGKRYTCNDDFGAKWGEWFANDLFSPIEKLGAIPEIGNTYLGVKRIVGGELEYWIGLFFAENTTVPDVYDFADIEPMDYAICWIYGKDNSELLSMETHNLCLETIAKEGYKRKEDSWCIESYTCPRFTTPDESGNIILDYYLAIEG
jgi:predicted transcriptional regulator YdeE